MARSEIASNGELIKRKLGVTQEAFAEMVGIGDRGLRKWLKNGVDSLKTLAQIAKIFGCSVEDLICYK